VVELDADDRVTVAAIAMFGMGSTPLRAPEAERALVGHAASDASPSLTDIAQLAVSGLEPPDDVHATGAYRARIGAHLVERVLTRAIEEATSAPR
jgi:carbon-monoxide dehydrogenase medium subunit